MPAKRRPPEPLRFLRVKEEKLADSPRLALLVIALYAAAA
jgi:hypothetical protein